MLSSGSISLYRVALTFASSMELLSVTFQMKAIQFPVVI